MKCILLHCTRDRFWTFFPDNLRELHCSVDLVLCFKSAQHYKLKDDSDEDDIHCENL